jgi:hypothetical protein
MMFCGSSMRSILKTGGLDILNRFLANAEEPSVYFGD